MKWGLNPISLKDSYFEIKMINARYETLSYRKSFKNLINTYRCLIPIDGYFEWKISNDKK
ncbi:MAG: hypothetical protein CMF96_04110 [Candidatus Marinimicrobia bacterium]|nr:hypothetical protein [Candidatus Neomarinimicrobiota bacterium]|tara:strand:+ start:1005 stop:1184 length:180 start_codon:yes stop_codon:yes gene_type:complete